MLLRLLLWKNYIAKKQPAKLHQHFLMSDSHSVSREAEPVEDESPLGEEEEEEEMEEGEVMSDKEESPMGEDGSGYEGSAVEDTFMADRAFWTAESETGSGESWQEEPNKGNFLGKGLHLHGFSLFFFFRSSFSPASCSLICPCLSACRCGNEGHEAVVP